MAAFLALLTALPAFIQALPYIFQVTLKIMTLFEKLIDWTQRRDFNNWLSECEKTIDKLDQAQTAEEKRAAARGIVDLIRKLGP
jgi:hypothetical protein